MDFLIVRRGLVATVALLASTKAIAYKWRTYGLSDSNSLAREAQTSSAKTNSEGKQMNPVKVPSTKYAQSDNDLIVFLEWLTRSL